MKNVWNKTSFFISSPMTILPTIHKALKERGTTNGEGCLKYK